jgi:hypothetical protein
MPARILILTALVASGVSSVVTLAVALLVLPPVIRAAPDLQATQPVVRAERFELVGPNGQLRAILGFDQALEQQPVVGLILMGPSGQQQAVIGLTPEGNFGTIRLNDRAGEFRAGLDAAADGNATVRLGDTQHLNVSLGTIYTPVGEGAGLQIRQASRVRADLTVGNLQASSGLMLADNLGRRRASVEVTGDRTSLVIGETAPDNLGWSGMRLVRRQDATMLDISDTSGRPRATTGVSPDGTATISVLDEAGEPIWQAP